MGGVVIALTAAAFALAGWEIYPRLLSRAQMLRTSPGRLFFARLAAAVIAGSGAALLVASFLPDEGADSPVAATAGSPAHLAAAAPAPPPVKAAKRPVQRRSAANPTAGSSAEPGSCSTRSGLGREQCAACAGQSTSQRRVCEEKVKDLYCQGRAGLDPACPGGERAQAFPSGSQY